MSKKNIQKVSQIPTIRNKMTTEVIPESSINPGMLASNFLLQII
jgi:hypothetical protein